MNALGESCLLAMEADNAAKWSVSSLINTDHSKDGIQRLQTTVTDVIAYPSRSRIMPIADHLALWSKDECDQNQLDPNPTRNRLTQPGQRSKLTACLNGQNLYVVGGRMKNGEIVRDLWKYNIGTRNWQRLEANDLPRVEGHAIASTETGTIYLFGGTFSRVGCPLWSWKPGSSAERVTIDQSVPAPGSRRGHSLTCINGSLFLFGGYIDLHGSTDALWQFNCGSKQWSLMYTGDGPVGRHGHSAVAFNGALYVFGGLNDLHSLGDFWKFDKGSDKAPHKWNILRTIVNPGARFGHSCCVTQTKMFLFGGKDGNGNRKDDLWCYDFLKKDWSRIMCDSPCRPHASAFSSMIALEPDYIAGNSNIFTITKSPEYQMHKKLEEEAGECTVCKGPFIVDAPLKHDQFFMDNAGITKPCYHPSGHQRSPGSADSGFQDQYIRSTSKVGLLANSLRSPSIDTQPYMINMAFERGSTDIEEHNPHSRQMSEIPDVFDSHVSNVELFLPEEEEREEEQLPGIVPEPRSRSSSTRSTYSHHTHSARSSAHSHRSNVTTTSCRRSPSEALLSPTPITHSPLVSHRPLSRERLLSTPMYSQHSPVHDMPPSALNNNSLTRSLNLLPDSVFTEEAIEMTQMTHFTRNSFNQAHNHFQFPNHLTVPDANERATTGFDSRVHVAQQKGNFCAHTDGRCVQIMLIGGKCDQDKVVGDKPLPDQMSVWRCCIRKL